MSIPETHEDKRKDKSKQTETEPSSSLPPKVNASQITRSAVNSWACGSGNMAYGVCVCVCVCARKCVFAYNGWKIRGKRGDRGKEGKDDLGVMRASKITVPSSIMGLNLIC